VSCKEPVERLAKLHEVFTQGNTGLGQRTLPLERQSAQATYPTYRENVRWTMGDVVFLTLSLPAPRQVVPRTAPR